MFSYAYKTVIESTYVLIAGSKGGTTSYGTAFAVAPGILATVAHVLYKNAGDSSSFQERITVLRAPEIRPNQSFEEAEVLGIDDERDIAFVKIKDQLDNTYVTMTTRASIAEEVGTIGFPRIHRTEMKIPIPRFQGGHLSASYQKKSALGRSTIYFETDFPMYEGSSGSPGFLIDGKVFGLHAAELWSGDEESREQRAFSMWIPTLAILELAKEHNVVANLA